MHKKTPLKWEKTVNIFRLKKKNSSAWCIGCKKQDLSNNTHVKMNEKLAIRIFDTLSENICSKNMLFLVRNDQKRFSQRLITLQETFQFVWSEL